jgi:hypothetical protein
VRQLCYHTSLGASLVLTQVLRSFSLRILIKSLAWCATWKPNQNRTRHESTAARPGELAASLIRPVLRNEALIKQWHAAGRCVTLLTLT